MSGEDHPIRDRRHPGDLPARVLRGPVIAVPTLVRLEYLTSHGWAVGHAGINLLDPARYVTRLATNGKIGRAIELDAQLRPTGTVWQNHDPSCIVCSGEHPPPYDGSCLI